MADMRQMELAAKEGEANSALALGLFLLESADRKVRGKGVWWIERAAELGNPGAQLRLADMLSAEKALTLYGIRQNEDDAAWWRAVAADSERPTTLRKMIERDWSVLSSASKDGAFLSLLPVGELQFNDIQRIGIEMMRLLLHDIGKDVFALALAIDDLHAMPRLRHFLLTSMSERAASMMMRDILAVDIDQLPFWLQWEAQGMLVSHLRDLIDDGNVVLPADLADELWTRERLSVKPQSGGPYDFTCHHKEFHAALERLARRSSRGLPIPPPDNPAQGWYAHHLCDQPNATIRAALNGVGECDLWDFLYGSADFTRFRFWQVSSADMRSHLVEAQGEQTAVLEMGTSGKAAMDAALMEWHREGKIAWWPEAG